MRILLIIGFLAGITLQGFNVAATSLPSSVAVFDVAAQGGIRADRASMFSILLQDYLRNTLKIKVIARSDIEAMLGLERMKDMLACEDTSCMAQIGGALGV